MATLTATRFLELLERSKLVTDNQLKEALAKVEEQSGADSPEDSAILADHLIDLGLITKWQANNLLNGKHRGFMLGKFKLLGLLGTGGMSSVYLGEHADLGSRVAIKVLPRNKIEDSSYLDRFKREAKAAANLHHKNVVRAHDIDCQTEGKSKTYYFVMDYVEGPDLAALVKRNGPLDFETAAEYIAQAAEGLEYAHSQGLIHRDIKPANLLVDKTNTVKILDMGLAKITDDEQPSLTVAHDENVLGTADYLAPEQAISSHDVDHRADIYSLGCTLYFLLTGHPPFNEGTLPQRLMKHQTQTPPSIYEDRADVPQGLVNICLRMMVKAPDGRYQKSGDVAHDVRAWLKSYLSGTDQAAKTLRTRKPRMTGDTDPDMKQIDTIKSQPRTRRTSDSNPIDIEIDTSDSDKRRTAAASPRRGLGDLQDSGEFAFDAKPKHGSSRRRRTSRSLTADPTATPLWIWGFLALGVVTVLFLLYLLLTS